MEASKKLEAANKKLEAGNKKLEAQLADQLLEVQQKEGQSPLPYCC